MVVKMFICTQHYNINSTNSTSQTITIKQIERKYFYSYAT